MNPVPTKLVDSEMPNEAALTLAQVVFFFRRHLLLIGLTAFLSALLGFVVFRFVLPPSYEASALLRVGPVAPDLSMLENGALTGEEYQLLLESDGVVATARQALIEQGLISSQSSFGVGRPLRSELFGSTGSALVLKTIARSRDPEKAAEFANRWSRAFLDQAARLATGATSRSVKYLEEQYPASEEILVDLEGEHLELSLNHSRAVFDTERDWATRLLELERGTAQRLAAFEIETKRLIEEYRVASGRELATAELSALLQSFQSLTQRRLSLAPQLHAESLRLARLKALLAATPPLIELRKAISADALWLAAALENPGRGEGGERSWQDDALVTQVMNPNHTELASAVNELEGRIASLEGEGAQIEGQLSSVSEGIGKLQEELSLAATLFEELELTRRSGLRQLEAELSNQKALLQKKSLVEIGARERSGGLQLSQTQREVEQTENVYKRFVSGYSDAMIAKSQMELETVRLASPAVPPWTPRDRGTLRFTVLFGLFGAFLGVGAGLVREVL